MGLLASLVTALARADDYGHTSYVDRNWTCDLRITVEPKTYNHTLLYATVEKVNTQGVIEIDETNEVPVVAKKLINDVSRPLFVAKEGADFWRWG